MTSNQMYQGRTRVMMSNADYLAKGLQHESVPPEMPEPQRTALACVRLEVLAAMVVAGDTGEKTFARKKLKRYIATGKRLALAEVKKKPRAITQPEKERYFCPNCFDVIELAGSTNCSLCNSKLLVA